MARQEEITGKTNDKSRGRRHEEKEKRSDDRKTKDDQRTGQRM
jgi:hypothetical protein